MTSTAIGTPPLYSITDWDKHFENNRTREMKVMQWIPLQNKHDGDGYTELLDHENGTLHFAAWVALAQLASRCKPRGILVRDGGRPHTPETISRVTRIPSWIFAEVMPRLVEMGWLNRDGAISTECVDPAPMPHPPADEGKGKEGNRIEEDTPPSPRRGRKSTRSMSLADKKKNRVETNTDLQNRIGAFLGRRPSTLWTLHQAELLDHIGTPHPDDISLLMDYYCMRFDGDDYRRRTLETLLANWDGECEKARPIVAKAKRKAVAISKAAQSAGTDDLSQGMFDCVDELVEAMQKSGKTSPAAEDALIAISHKHGRPFAEEVAEMAKRRVKILEQQKGGDDGKTQD